MFDWFKSKPIHSDFGFLGLDFHSHLVPGVDDGAKDTADAVRLLSQLQELGFTKAITTPHIMSDLYPNTPQVLREGFAVLQSAAKAAGLTIQTGLAAEYMMDDHFADILDQEELLSIDGERVLVEMSMLQAPSNLFRDLFQLQIKGFRPVLAHPERYIFLKEDFRQYDRLRDHGCEFQLNLLSITGYYGKPVRENALKLLKLGMIDYLSTDMHHDNHATALQVLATDRSLMKILCEYPFKNQEIA
jgi:protein-tyrosine phosphatase